MFIFVCVILLLYLAIYKKSCYGLPDITYGLRKLWGTFFQFDQNEFLLLHYGLLSLYIGCSLYSTKRKQLNHELGPWRTLIRDIKSTSFSSIGMEHKDLSLYLWHHFSRFSCSFITRRFLSNLCDEPSAQYDQKCLCKFQVPKRNPEVFCYERYHKFPFASHFWFACR